MNSHDEKHELAVESARRALSSSETQVDRAIRLAAVARDSLGSIPDRIDFLRLALAADVGVARVAAIQILISGADPALRLVSASVLLSTRGSEDDVQPLLSLQAAEREPIIREELQRALSNIEFADVRESLVALAEFLGLKVSPNQLDPAVLIPNSAHSARLRRWADKTRTRASNRDAPPAFLDAAIVLSELMVDLALLAVSGTTEDIDVSSDELEKIDDGLYGRPSHDDLLHRATLLDKFDWFKLCVELRQHRAAFADISRSSARTSRASEEVNAVTVLSALIMMGWIDTMHKYYIAPSDPD